MRIYQYRPTEGVNSDYGQIYIVGGYGSGDEDDILDVIQISNQMIFPTETQENLLVISILLGCFICILCIAIYAKWRQLTKSMPHVQGENNIEVPILAGYGAAADVDVVRNEGRREDIDGAIVDTAN